MPTAFCLTGPARACAPFLVARSLLLATLIFTGLASVARAQGASAPAAAGPDPAAGGMSFVQCADCHSTRSGDGVGPGLQGIAGRRAGSHAGFHYSPAMGKSTIVWDAKTLDAFLARPQAAVPGTTMDFPGIDDPVERANVVAYLATLR